MFAFASSELFAPSLVITLVWFLLYWVFGGVFFATITILRVIKLRRGRFSCLFTVLSAGFAYGAAYSGVAFSRLRVEECLREAGDFFERLASIFGCGILEILASGVLWFLLLLVCGFAILLISRAQNASWVDAKGEAKRDAIGEEDQLLHFDDTREH